MKKDRTVKTILIAFALGFLLGMVILKATLGLMSA